MIENFFEIHHENKDSLARTGVMHLPHGDVETPVFMPVGTKGTVKALTKDDLEEIGFEIILANTYHMYLRPGADLVKEAGGLHGFTKWNRNFLTDSGGFQVWSLSKLRKIKNEGIEFRSDIDGSKHFFTPENVVQTQVKLNSDIQMQLDVCSGFGVDRAEAERALRLSSQWAQRAITEWNIHRESGYKGILFPIVQGNFFDDLRKESAEFVDSLDTPGLAIGGLSVGEPADIYAEKLQYTVQFLSRSKPRYVMGLGTPEYILEAVANGISLQGLPVTDFIFQKKEWFPSSRPAMSMILDALILNVNARSVRPIPVLTFAIYSESRKFFLPCLQATITCISSKT